MEEKIYKIIKADMDITALSDYLELFKPPMDINIFTKILQTIHTKKDEKLSRTSILIKDCGEFLKAYGEFASGINYKNLTLIMNSWFKPNWIDENKEVYMGGNYSQTDKVLLDFYHKTVLLQITWSILGIENDPPEIKVYGVFENIDEAEKQNVLNYLDTLKCKKVIL